jgi:hypothetical protein
MRIKIIVTGEPRESRLLSHAEYQTFKELSEGHDFTIKPKGHHGVEVTAPISLWNSLGY